MAENEKLGHKPLSARQQRNLEKLVDQHYETERDNLRDAYYKMVNEAVGKKLSRENAPPPVVRALNKHFELAESVQEKLATSGERLIVLLDQRGLILDPAVLPYIGIPRGGRNTDSALACLRSKSALEGRDLGEWHDEADATLRNEWAEAKRQILLASLTEHNIEGFLATLVTAESLVERLEKGGQ